MDKMLVDSLGDVTITNDGATILKEIDVQHPAAKIMVEITKLVDDEVGDGTKSAVVLAGSLLEKAEDLIGKNVHATIIVDRYRRAAEKAIDILREIGTKVVCKLSIILGDKFFIIIFPITLRPVPRNISLEILMP